MCLGKHGMGPWGVMPASVSSEGALQYSVKETLSSCTSAAAAAAVQYSNVQAADIRDAIDIAQIILVLEDSRAVHEAASYT